jgi:hypothetical protein
VHIQPWIRFPFLLFSHCSVSSLELLQVTLSFQRMKAAGTYQVSLKRRVRASDGSKNELPEDMDDEPRPGVQSSSILGVGITLGEGLEVTSVDPESTRGADVMVGDRVVSVNGIKVKGMPAKKAAKLLSGRMGTHASILLIRKRKLIVVSLPRLPSAAKATRTQSPTPPPSAGIVSTSGYKPGSEQKTASSKFGGFKELGDMFGSLLGKMGGKIM